MTDWLIAGAMAVVAAFIIWWSFRREPKAPQFHLCPNEGCIFGTYSVIMYEHHLDNCNMTGGADDAA